MSKNPYRPISAKLSKEDVEKLKVVAQRRGVYYGDLVAEAVQFLLAQDDRNSVQKTNIVIEQSKN